MRYITLLVLLCSVCLWSSCKKEKSDTGSSGAFLQIQFINEVDGQPFQLGTPYRNGFDESFTVSDYKYYVSNVELLNPVKSFLVPDGYFLIDEQKPDSKTIKMSIKADSYDALVFMIGVDSARQVKGAQTGALDPANGMFWNPNLGYMAARLEGQSTSSGAPGNLLSHQIGGFEGQYNSLRYAIVNFPVTMTVGAGQTLQLVIRKDLLSWFDAIYPMPIADHPTIVAPGSAAMRIADNYSEQFSLTSVEVK